MQLRVPLASFAVVVVSVSPPLTGAMDALVDVVMAVMSEDAVSNRIVICKFGHLYTPQLRKQSKLIVL